jgi:predicted MFS family arabinose efflux permease
MTDTISRRLRPLLVAQLLQGVAPWVPVEKVFMTELGFTPALFATMAAAYAAVGPVVEIPSGILADRWSRRGVLMLAGAAGVVSVLVGALAQGVASYVASAMCLGVYFALQSGTVDAIVYDTLLEELGTPDDYERRYGRIQLLNSLALAMSAVAGGVIAGLTSARVTYVTTLPFAIAGLAVLTRFREPTLHRRSAPSSVQRQLEATFRTLTRQPGLAPIVLASVVVATTTQLVFEFGPLWLLGVGVTAPALGPYTAAMTATLGTGGPLAAWLRFDRRGPAALAGLATVACALTLVVGSSAWLVTAGQVGLMAVLAGLAVHLSRRLHDAVPSDLRTGVSSGVGTLSWLLFLPSSLAFGVVSSTAGLAAAGWLVVVLTAVAAGTLVRLARAGRPAGVDPGPTGRAAMVPATAAGR